MKIFYKHAQILAKPSCLEHIALSVRLTSNHLYDELYNFSSRVIYTSGVTVKGWNFLVNAGLEVFLLTNVHIPKYLYL